jgi:serine/threonine protein kinase
MSSAHVPVENLLTAEWLQCEPLLRRFELVWQSGTEPNIAEFVPIDSRHRRGVLLELVLTDMEFRSRAGQKVRVEYYLEQFPELASTDELIVDLVIGEMQLRTVSKSDISVAELTDRFPDLAQRIQQKVETITIQGSLASTHRTNVAENVSFNQPHSWPSIPGFEPVSILGQGSMGIVYEAKQIDLGRDVALKVVRSSTISPTNYNRFRAEAEAAAALRHKNIVQIFAVGEHEGQPFLVLELVRGQTLEDVWSNALIDWRSAAEAVEILSIAVEHAHQCKIVHRDLKPSNILVDSSALLRITDFGMAKGIGIDESMTMTGDVLGTPAYMSPEQASGDSKRVGPSADIYSLGAILYRALTGVPPFVGTSPLDTMAQVRWREPIPPRRLQPSLPRDLESVCLKCLSKEPGSRYASAGEIAEDLRNVLDGKPVRARRSSSFERFVKWSKRRPAIAALTFLLSFIWIFGSVGVIYQWRIAKESLANARQREHDRFIGLIDSLAVATPESASIVLKSIRDELPAIRPMLIQRERSSKAREKNAEEEQLVLQNRIHLLLIDSEPKRLIEISRTLIEAAPAEFMFLRSELKNVMAKVRDEDGRHYSQFLENVSKHENRTEQARFHASLALTISDDLDLWSGESKKIVDYLLAVNPLHLQLYYQALKPLASPLVSHLTVASTDRSRSPESRLLAATLLSDTLATKATELLEVLLDANDEQFSVLIGRLLPLREQIMPQLRNVLTESLPSRLQSDAMDRQIQRISNAALALFFLGDLHSVWPLLKASERPDLRTSLIHRLHLVVSDPKQILAQLDVETDDSIRRALLLSLGELTGFHEKLTTDESFIARLLKMYRVERDAGIHSASRWLLQKLGKSDDVAREDAVLATHGISGDRDWYVTSHGHSMTIIRGPVEFIMGVDPETLPMAERLEFDLERPRRIQGTWSIGMIEITKPQIRQFRRTYATHPVSNPDPNGAATSLQWYDVVKYCRWLSEQERIPEDQMCYPKADQIKAGMKLTEGYLSRTGYRLPSEAEWEYACRAGTNSRYSFGDSAVFGDSYAWTMYTAKNRIHVSGLLKPNDFGLFDCHGNVLEWCQERFTHQLPDVANIDDVEDLLNPLQNNQGRPIRGGGYHDRLLFSRSTVRRVDLPVLQGYAGGFRIVRTLE